MTAYSPLTAIDPNDFSQVLTSTGKSSSRARDARHRASPKVHCSTRWPWSHTVSLQPGLRHGLLPELVEFGGDAALANLNEQVMQLVAPARAGKHALLGDRGPFWYRGFAMGSERLECPLVAKTLEAVGARQMVIGHTVQDHGVGVRCDGTLHLIDVGISRAYGGEIAAWECTVGAAGPMALYHNSAVVLSGSSEADSSRQKAGLLE
ncbi:hypothetical protein CYMTET_23113 [Cymbomonas tetramitiformis]|uniref:Uncharacterized protein n=1 Tax=Cymbomonas tetramitiformis TaxID=36881 RepID=A0AAE0L194_9CHLO|nr:hypothetical protein CYMTET_23113 [Cymbomonas tetramitiformis]